MFSGSNPSNDLYWANALAQAQSQNNSLDWALLAQQWISHQRNINPSFETSGRNDNTLVSPADAPPAPKISIKSNEEQGEADMDVEDDQMEPLNQNFITQPTPQIWSISSGPMPMSLMTPQVPAAPIPATPWNIWNTSGILNTNLPPPTLHIPEISTPLIGSDKINKNTVIPSLMDTPVNAPVDTQFPTLDAAKRKTLPAWIREGLEKMEREKQKQLEKEKASEIPDKDSNKYDNQSFIENLQAIDKSDGIGSNKANKNSSNYKGFLKNSALSSDDSEKSDNESESEKINYKDSSTKVNPWHGKTREEIEEEMMLVVRRSLTEILLEITNDEIRNIAQETFKRHKLKASSAQVIRKSALTSISGNLGLGAYDSDSDTDSDTEDETTKKDDKDCDKDSEDELRETMLSRQRSFKAIAREIDILVEKEEARQEEIRQERLRREQLERSSERLLLQSGDNDIEHSSSSGNSGNFVGNSSGVDGNGGQLRRNNYDRDFGETQHDKKSYSSNGQKRLKERTSRFSDNKESKNKSTSSTSSSSTGYLLPTSGNTLSSTNLLNSATSTTSKLIQHQQSPLLNPSAHILTNSAAAENFLMANAVLSEAFLKNDKKKLKSSSSSNRKNKRSKNSRSRSRSRSTISSTSSNNSENKSSRSSHSSKTTSSSSNSSNSSKTSEYKKFNKKDKKRSKSRETSHDFDKKTEEKSYKNNRDLNDRLDSAEYNHSRSHYHRHYHFDDDDDDYRRHRRQYDNSPDSDDYYRSRRRRHHTNSSSSRSSSHRVDKKDYYYSTSSNHKRSHSRRENTRSRSRSKSYSSRDKQYEKY
ncbi:arginine/serine-rich protein PNISR-like [Condylostylus longicornis]|uniref:arginine/serine-rich protein PNISR-like n=1 Tax=Condylostylus longicornis TaxID=2530218 RepID=UPI00244E014D|nr:arginine/serine-rich protein PNISR-like [Condylostylus longicornis]